MTLCIFVALVLLIMAFGCYAQIGDHETLVRNDPNRIYGNQKEQVRPQPYHPVTNPLIQKNYYDVPGTPLDPFGVNITPEEQEENQVVGAIGDGADLTLVGNNVLRASVASAEPEPPTFSQLPELGPQRMLKTTFKSSPVTYLDHKCNYFSPAPRLFATDLDELQARRAMYQDTNYPEPPSRRQSWIQLLTAEFRNRKDIYTTATQTNDLSNLSCKRLKEKIPEYSNWPSNFFAGAS